MHHHHHSDYVDVVSANGPAKLSATWQMVFILMAIVGFGAFAYGAFFYEGHERIGWIAFLHNFYFFTGLSAAGVVLAAIIQTARAMWGRPIKRYMEACGAFLPVSIICLIVLYFGAEHLYEWISNPPGGNKHLWLQKNFVFGRVLVYLSILTIVAHKFTSLSLRPDLGLAHQKNPDLWPAPANWGNLEDEVQRCQAKQTRLAVMYCITFAVCISMTAYDLIMSLDYNWFSTMFGAWNFTTFMLLAWGSHFFITAIMGKKFGLTKYYHKKMFHDLGKLTFGFTVVWGYLFFAQLMVIWYGNLPHETGYLITRFKVEPWRTFSWVVFAMVFLLPFILGLSKSLKMSPKTFGPVVVISFIGIWIERFVLITPSTWYFDRHAGQFEGGITTLLIFDVLVFIGFFGLFALLYTRNLYKKPAMVISDPRLDEGINRH